MRASEPQCLLCRKGTAPASGHCWLYLLHLCLSVLTRTRRLAIRWHSDGREKRRQETTTKRYNVLRGTIGKGLECRPLKITGLSHRILLNSQQTTKFTKNCLSIGNLAIVPCINEAEQSHGLKLLNCEKANFSIFINVPR